MPRKKDQEAPEDQGERFRREAQRLIDAGELSPIEAEESVDRMIRKVGKNPLD